jgi:chemotaxis protein methyltransferase CheR
MITPEDYGFVAALLKQHSGLSLGDGKAYLLESRLPPIAATYGHPDITGLFRALRLGAPPHVVKAVCDAMTTGETLFFRDTTPYTALKQQLLPSAVARASESGRPVRIWCAACSTGQEPYSVAMTIVEMQQELRGTTVEITATDYSAQALARAKEGIYNQFEIQRGLPIQNLVKYFRPVDHGFQINPELRQRIKFEEINLLKPFPVAWQFDIIFCRNVLIYFDTATKKDVLERMARTLNRHGTILLGGTESTLGVTESLAKLPGTAGGIYGRPVDIEASSRVGARV